MQCHENSNDLLPENCFETRRYTIKDPQFGYQVKTAVALATPGILVTPAALVADVVLVADATLPVTAISVTIDTPTTVNAQFAITGACAFLSQLIIGVDLVSAQSLRHPFWCYDRK
jgi:hypothetical protein